MLDILYIRPEDILHIRSEASNKSLEITASLVV